MRSLCGGEYFRAPLSAEHIFGLAGQIGGCHYRFQSAFARNSAVFVGHQFWLVGVRASARLVKTCICLKRIVVCVYLVKMQ